MRLIDGEELERLFNEQIEQGATDAFDAFDDALQDTPTVDAVAVTRCKDCKHYRNHPNGLCYLHTEPKTNARGYSGEAVCVEPEDFCSYGERKDGADAEG
jgi:hypothetical protein